MPVVMPGISWSLLRGPAEMSLAATLLIAIFMWSRNRGTEIRLRVLSAGLIASFVLYSTLDVLRAPVAAYFMRADCILACRIALLLTTFGLLAYMFRILPSPEPSASPVEKRSGSKNTGSRYAGDQLLILRFFAFFCVYVTHNHILFAMPLANTHNFPGVLLMGCAHSGMVIFFTLSGYLMGKAFFRARYAATAEGIKAFYKNRMLRIVPLCFAAAFITTLFVYPELLKPHELVRLWRLYTFNYYGIDGRPIGALWSLSVEMQYYLIAPFVFILCAPLFTTRRRVTDFAALVIICGIAFQFLMEYINADWYATYVAPVSNLPYFLSGFAVNGLIKLKHPQTSEELSVSSLRRHLALAVFSCICCYMLATCWEYGNLTDFISRYLPPPHKTVAAGSAFDYYGLCVLNDMLHKMLDIRISPYICALLSMVCIYNIEQYRIIKSKQPDKSVQGRGIINRISTALQVMGTLTYGFYVWHPPVLAALAKVMSPAATLPAYLAQCCYGFVFVAILSAATYFFIERPFERMKS
jgi:peptidoglycan/LPS O-acetylase OafA/YrhL